MRTTFHLSMTFLSIVMTAAPSCRPDPPAGREVPGPHAESAPANEGDAARASMGRYRLDSRPDLILTLPPELREVSGIAFSADGRLFAHNDERGTVWQIDTSTGEILKRFSVGERRLRKDLEDIAIAGDTFWLANSAGTLFSFGEGGDGDDVPYGEMSTPLTAKNDVEGLCLDPGSRSLLLACKGDPGEGHEDVRAVYAFDLEKREFLPSPRFLIDLGELRSRFGVREFMPSAIGRHPASGNFFLLSAVGNSIVEISPDGTLFSCADLPGKYHGQPEGIAFDGNGRLFIANEGPSKGKIAVYGIGGK